MSKIKLQKGFTLIEMMIAMTIFVIFMGVVVQSYLSIVRSQREANEYRVMYSEARYVFDKFSDEVRNAGISYKQGMTNPLTELVLVSPDGGRAVKFEYVNGAISFAEAKMGVDGSFEVSQGYNLNSDRIKVKEFRLYISPLVDPYKPENVYNSATQYQPKVTLFAKFEKEVGGGRTLDIDLQTTISSRSYMPGYDAENAVLIFGSVVQTALAVTNSSQE
ncbi:MAG: type II secretion system protein [Candidatus Gracilibacteria bacterium]|jgi:prepilin-type N-terminal cleavage/methylation domain-containing protein